MTTALSLTNARKTGGIQQDPSPRSQETMSRKLQGYEFVNYRADCEQSTSNGLIKYVDVVNYGRRISEAYGHNCVMCGAVDVVIPTQNKDVCKSCDSSFWYNPTLNVVFKFCKGCKNFVTLEMFSDKPDASKCCRCRRRGRENYLTKKYTDVSPAVSQGMYTPSSHSDQTPLVGMASPTSLMNSVKALDSLRSDGHPSASSSMLTMCTPHSLQDSGDLLSSSRKPYKKRTLSVDDDGHTHDGFYGGNPLKPPKTPRSNSLTLDCTSYGQNATLPQATDLKRHNSFGTPGGTHLNFVTPGSSGLFNSHSKPLSRGSLSGNSALTLTRSDSTSSTSDRELASSLTSIHRSISTHRGQTSRTADSPGQYLWERADGVGSPVLHDLQLPSIRSLQQQSTADGCTGTGAVKYPSVRFAETESESNHTSTADRQSPGDKENRHNHLAMLTSLQHLPLFQDNSDGKAGVKSMSPDPGAVSRSSWQRNSHPGKDSHQLGELAIDPPTGSRSSATSPSESQGSTPTNTSTSKSDSSGGSVPSAGLHRSDSITSECEEQSPSDECEATTSSFRRESPGGTHWEWDPEFNPLMHLASMISEHRSSHT